MNPVDRQPKWRSLDRSTRRELAERVQARHAAQVTEPAQVAVRAERDAR